MYIKINTTWNNWLMYFSWLSKINKYRPFSLTHLSNLLWSHSFLDDKLFYSRINANLSLGKRWKGGRALWLLVVYHLATLELISYIKSGNPCLLSLSQRRTYLGIYFIFFEITLYLGLKWSASHELFKYAILLPFTPFMFSYVI